MIRIDHLGSIEGQEVLLYQLFQNIISNAIKYQKPNIPPIVNIRVKHLEDKQVQISFEDNGIGIPTENHHDIFDMFKLANNVDTQRGHGIGLSTCKEIVEIHNGKICLDSVQNLGTTIHVILPLFMYIPSKTNLLENNLSLT